MSTTATTPAPETTALQQLDTARQILAEARTLDEAKKIRNVAEAARLYAKAAHMGREAQNYAGEIKLLAERKAGEILKQLEKSDGGRPAKTADSVSAVSEYAQALQETQTNERTARRWQKLVEVPESAIHSYARYAQETGTEITTSGLMKEFRKGTLGFTPKQADRRQRAETEVHQQRAWIDKECPHVAARVQGSIYGVQARSSDPNSGSAFDVQFQSVTAEELREAALAIERLRQEKKPTAAVQNAEAAEATQDSAPKKAKSEDEIITPHGHRMDVAKSSMQKAVRAGDQDAAVYWATEIALAGRYSIAKRRLLVTSVEDIGLADPDAIVQGWELLKGAKMSDDTSRNRTLIQAARRLASAPKKRIVNHATCWAYKTKHAIKAPATEKEVSDNVFTFRAVVNEKDERHALALASVLDKASSSGLVWDFLLGFARDHSPVLFKRVQVLHEVWRNFGARPDQPNAMKWLSEARLCYAQAIMLCCRASEDLTLTSVPDLAVASDAEVQRIYTERTRLEPPDHAIDMHTLQGKQMGRDIVHFLLYGAVLANETDMPDPYKEEAYRLWLGSKGDKFYAALKANALPITTVDEELIFAASRSRVPEPPLPYGTIYKRRGTTTTRTGKVPGHWYVCCIEDSEGPKRWRENLLESYKDEADADAHVRRLMTRQAVNQIRHQRKKALAVGAGRS